MANSAEHGARVDRGHYCEKHDLEFEDRTWCPQCEVEFELRADGGQVIEAAEPGSRRYVTYCPCCLEWCDFKDEGPAERLAENHDENYHDGESVTAVLDTSSGGESDAE